MKKTRFFSLLAALLWLLTLAACGNTQKTEPTRSPEETREPTTAETGDTNMQTTLQLTVGDTPVTVSWENNASVQALAELAAANPLRIGLSMYGGFEQVGALGTTLPQNDRRITASAGDLMLYSGDQIVLFYGSNTWSYTRLGKITGQTQAELTALLGNGNVTVTISNGG